MFGFVKEFRIDHVISPQFHCVMLCITITVQRESAECMFLRVSGSFYVTEPFLGHVIRGVSFLLHQAVPRWSSGSTPDRTGVVIMSVSSYVTAKE